MTDFNYMLKIAKLFDEGRINKEKYNEADKLLDQYLLEKHIDLSNYIKLKLSLYSRIHQLLQAKKILEENKINITDKEYNNLFIRYLMEIKDFQGALNYFYDHTDVDNYLEGIILFKLGIYKNANPKLKKAILEKSKINIYTYYQLISYYLETCPYLEKNNQKEISFCMNEISRLINSQNEIDKYALKDHQHFYLLMAIYNKDEDKSDSYLDTFFQSKQIYKTFESIIRYSRCLNFEPSNELLLTAFERNWKYFDENNYFSKIIEAENDINVQKIYIRILYWILIILNQLMVKDDSSVSRFNYYTTYKSLLKMVKHEYKVAMLSLSNVNDKVEGEVLFDILKKRKFISSDDFSYESTYAALQTSYTRNKDSLTMFRLYGKEEGKEGTGACLSFDKNFFLTNSNYYTSGRSDKTETKKNADEIPEYIDGRNPIFWILYYDDKEDRFYYYPDKDSVVPYIINLHKNTYIWNNFYSGSTKRIQENRLGYSFIKLFTILEQIKKTDISKRNNALKLFEKFRYFIKYDSFAEEKECRMLELVIPKDAEIIEANSVLKRDYKYIDEVTSLQEIILGPKVPNEKIVKELLMREIDRTKIDPDIYISDAPLA